VTDKEDFLESENARLRALLKQAGLDAEANEVARNLQQLLLAELHHRIRNMLAMVQSIVSQTLRSTPSPSEAAEAIGSRIAALARTHDIILSTAGDDSSLPALVDAITAPFGKSRFQISIPAVEIGSRTAVGLALALNELATNAVKYGGLSAPAGSVEITGQTDEEAHELVITWVEHGGPAVQASYHPGFGTQLMHTVLPTEPVVEFRPTGVWCELRVPFAAHRDS
jgi:two-component sensor histidine kinase